MKSAIDASLLRGVTFRNIHCTEYYECLQAAAISDTKQLNCDGCLNQYDKIEPDHFDNFDFSETLACARLLNQIFFGK
jgi:hypothetical protein